LHTLIFVFLYARQEDLLPVAMQPFVHPNSCFDAPTTRHTTKHLPLSICVWPLSMFHCSVTLGTGSCFAISGVDRPV